MNITPEQARKWRDDARPGPWYVHTAPGDPDGPCIYDDMGHMCIAVEPAGSDYLEADLHLAAAAPDLAQTIAGMRWEYRTEEWSGNYWYPCEEWYADASLHEGYISRDGGRLVRRLVGPVEGLDSAP